MSKNTESLYLTFGDNGISTVCRQNDTLGSYDIYYINPRRGMNYPRVLLLWKRSFLRSRAMEFIFSQTWSG
jgi:hypothetical protein